MKQLDDIGKRIIDLIAQEWTAQGHNLTGAFIEKMTYEIDGETISIYDNTDRGYGAILEQGVPASRIPYTRGSGAKTSKYIQGLALYAERRMAVDAKTALSIAFAIANKHKQEGMPTVKSAEFSSTGKRTGFVKDSEPKISAMIDEVIFETIGEIIQV